MAKIAFDVIEFRNKVASRLEEEKKNRNNPYFCSTEKSRNETDGYIRCLENILFMLPA